MDDDFMDQKEDLDLLEQLDDRRRMEMNQELIRIHEMNKVKRSLREGKITRNLLTKLQNGPLGELSEGLIHPRTRKTSRDTHDGITKEEAKQISHLSNYIKASRNEELESIRNMKLVQAGRADKDSRRRARRLFNHRVFVNLYQDGNETGDHKKSSSVLVTQLGEVPDKDEASNVIRQESQHVINNFFKIPSRRQRVLQRLNSEGKHILSTETRLYHNDENDSAGEEPMGKEPVQKTKRDHIHGLHGRLKHKKLKRSSGGNSKWTKKLRTMKEPSSDLVTVVDASNNRVTPEADARLSAGVTKHHHEPHESPLPPIPPAPPVPPNSWTSLPPFGLSGPPPPPSKASPSSPPGSGPPSKSPPPPKAVSISPTSADMPQQYSYGFPDEDDHSQELTHTMASLSSQDNVDVEKTDNDENEQLLMSEEKYKEDALFEQEVIIHATRTEEFIKPAPWEDVDKTTQLTEVEMYTEMTATIVASSHCIENDGSASQSEDETDDSDQDGLGDMNTSSTSSFTPQPHYKRYFSSPQLSVTVPSENDSLFDSHVIGPLQQMSIPHGYYTPMSVELNPFKFNEEERDSDHNAPVANGDGCAAAAVTLSGTSKPKQRQISVTEFEDDSPQEIPDHAFTNPNFMKYVKTLGREPLLEDYISFQLCWIGDQIDRKYDAQLNVALDAVLMDIIKSSISWKNFSAVAKRLLLEGQHVQDGLFMITCFGRRLSEVMPHFGDTINYYTQRVMDQYGADILLSIGGWNTLMESYSQVEVYEEEEYFDPYDNTQGPVCAPPVNHLHDNDLNIPPIIVEEHTCTCTLHTSVMPEQLHIPHQTPPTTTPHSHFFRSPSLLRRTVSVEVLFQETTDQTESNSNQETGSRKCSVPHSLPRSLSTSSLDTLTPGTATFFDFPHSNGGVFHYHSQLSRTEKKIQRDNVITVETVREECSYLARRHSRQSSFSSVTSVNIVGNPEIVARGGRLLTPANVSPNEELPDFFLSPSPSRSNTLAFRNNKESETSRGVTLKITVPMVTAAIAIGAVALGIWYLYRKK